MRLASIPSARDHHEQLQQHPGELPLCGVCRRDDLAALRELFLDLAVRSEQGRFLCWVSDPDSRRLR